MYSISQKQLKYVWCGTVTVQCWCGRSMLVVRSWCGLGALMVRSWCALGTLLVRSWFALGALLVRSWYAHDSLKSSIDESVRYGTRFGLLALGKRARMHGMHGQYVDEKTYFLVQLLLDRQWLVLKRTNSLLRLLGKKSFTCETISALRPLAIATRMPKKA